MISIGDDYVIENDRGERVYKLDGKALRIRKTIRFEDMDGRELCKIQERMLHLKDSMEIEDPAGHRIALVQKAMITPLRERWTVKIEDGPDLRVQGNVVDHEYTIERDGDRVAEVSKRWFRVRDTYGVEIEPGENDILILATAAVIDTMTHRGRLARGEGPAADGGDAGLDLVGGGPRCRTGWPPSRPGVPGVQSSPSPPGGSIS
jgi:uncharacterized protein YxjI